MTTKRDDPKASRILRPLLLFPLALAIVAGYIGWQIHRNHPDGEFRRQQDLLRFQENVDELKAGKTDLLFLAGFRDSDSLLEGIRGMPEIKSVFMDNSHITVAGMRQLATFPNLKCVESYGGSHDTGHSDEGMLELRNCKNLTTLIFHGGISQEGIAEMKRQIPNLRVITEHP